MNNYTDHKASIAVLILQNIISLLHIHNDVQAADSIGIELIKAC